MTFKRYSLLLLGFFLLVLTVVPVFNWLVDPFWYFRSMEIPGVNVIKPSYHSHERQVKSALVSKLRPEAIILGSSFAEIGLPVTHLGFTNEGQLRAYNLALPWAHGAELYCYTLFALAQPGVKRLVLGGFDLEAFPCTKYQNLGEADYTQLLLSKTAFGASVETLRDQDGRQVSSADGMWSYMRYHDGFRGDRDIITSFANSFRSKLCDLPQRNRSLDRCRIDHLMPSDDASTAGLRQVIRMARQNGIQLILIDFPKHVLFYEQERECGRLEAYWSRLWRIASIVEQEAGHDSQQIQFWSFYGYRNLNAEPIHAGITMAQRLWQDDGHFNPEVGGIAFDAIFGSNLTFGNRITIHDFDRILAEGEIERRTFLSNNLWIWRELDELRQAARRPPDNQPPVPR